MFSRKTIREGQYQIDVDIPHWNYLDEFDQGWLWRELGLAMEGRQQVLVLNCARTKEMREADDVLL